MEVYSKGGWCADRVNTLYKSLCACVCVWRGGCIVHDISMRPIGCADSLEMRDIARCEYMIFLEKSNETSFGST